MKDTTDSSIRLNISRWLTDGIIIAALSAYVYVLSFYYEKGFAYYFDIPRDFISINLSTLAIISLFLVLATILFGLNSYYIKRLIIDRVTDPKTNKNRRIPWSLSITITTALICIIVLMVYIFRVYWQILFLTILCIVLIFFEYIFRSKFKCETPDLIMFKWLFRVCMFLFLLFVGIMLSEGVGSVMAAKQRNFPVVCSSPELVVLRKYGDLLICSEFNVKTRELKRERRIIRLGEKTDIEFRLEAVGPLSSYANEGSGKERTAEDDSDVKEE